MSDSLRVNVVVVCVSNIKERAGTFEVFVTSGGFPKSSAVLVVAFDAVVVSCQPVFFALDGYAMRECCDVAEVPVVSFLVVGKFV